MRGDEIAESISASKSGEKTVDDFGHRANFLSKITERESAFIRKVKELQGHDPIYIWGSERGGRNLVNLLKCEGISFDGIVASRKYYTGQDHILCLEELLETCERINLIVAFKGYHSSLLAGFEDKIENLMTFDCWATPWQANQASYMSYS